MFGYVSTTGNRSVGCLKGDVLLTTCCVLESQADGVYIDLSADTAKPQLPVYRSPSMQLFNLFCAVALPAIVSAFPNAPFVTEGQWVHDSTGENFTYVGVNWPGAGEVMIPEGLQYQSVASIASKIKSLKLNVVRLTFAIEMIDDIKDNGGDITIQNAFKKALGDANGTTVYQQVIKNNPQFGPSTTRLQVRSTIKLKHAD